MKIPEIAPDWKNMSKLNVPTILNLMNSEEMNELSRKANEEYVYWDKFKYFTMPEGISSEVAWYYLKLIRQQQTRRILIGDKEGNKFSYCLTDSILRKISYIDKNAGGQILSEHSGLHTAEKERYLINSIMEEAIASSQLEGAATTRKKAKEMLRAGKKPKDKAEQMIINNYITIKNIKNFSNRALSKELIIEIQASITKETLDEHNTVGRFRNEQDEEINVIDQSDGKILYTPPSPDKIDESIKKMCAFANESSKEIFVHPIIKAIILHFWLAYIHPFIDGNGRTARAIFYWFMMKNGYWMFEYLSISRIIVKAPAQYARAYLYSEIDDLDITYFLVFNLKVIHSAIESLRNYLLKKQTELHKTEKIIRIYPNLNHRQSDLLQHAITHPDATYTIKFIEKRKIGKEFCYLPITNLNEKLKELSEKGERRVQ
jgi:Fic family protein